MPGLRAYEPFQAPAPMFSIGWGEDIDLSGGAAVIATILSQIPDYRDGTDDIIADVPLWIKRLLYADETVGDVAGAKLDADRPFGNTKNIWRAKQETSAEHPVLIHEWPGRGFFVPAGTKLSMTGSSAGAGIEQHTCILHCYSPGFTPSLRLGFGDPQRAKMYIAHGLKTGTLVAATLSGNNDLLGHTAAYEDSELSFGIDEAARYVLYGVVPRPGLAGVGIVGFKHPSGQLYSLFPSIFAADAPITYPMDQPWVFSGAEKAAPRLVGAGAVTTSVEFQPLFAVL